MKIKGWIVAGALAAGGVVFTIKGGGCLRQETAPDEQLASRFTSMCEIARANVSTPERGVRKLGRYLDKHAGDLLGEWGKTLAAIERIPDDRRHDERARLARKRLSKPLRACERDWERFGNAVENDPAASRLVENFSTRLNRTFEIIFSGSPRLDFVHLPQQLEALIREE